jgi:heterodisulfide reductase subunit B
MRPYLYYPGCSMDSSARAYHDSIAFVTEKLGIELDEIDDWNCCGASEYFSISLTGAQALVGRNLAIAERTAVSVAATAAAGSATDGGASAASATAVLSRAAVEPAREARAVNAMRSAMATAPGAGTRGPRREPVGTLVAACSMCYLNLAKVDHQLAEDRGTATRVNEALAAGGLDYDAGSVRVRHLLEVVVREVGLEEVRSHVVRPLTGLRVAPYLGCLLTRPGYDDRWSAFEHPVEFDRLIAALGAEVVDFPAKTDCCGGHMTQISPGTAFSLIRRLVASAERRGAVLMATVCPMCQMNVDAFQGEMNRYFHAHHHVPILFFTQLMGLAFGAEPRAVGIGTELVSASAALATIGIEVPAEPEEATTPDGRPIRRRPRKPQGLPMPRMPEDRDDEEDGR